MTFLTPFMVVLYIAVIIKRTSFGVYALIFLSFATTMAVFNVGDDSILVFHPLFLIVLVKFSISYPHFEKCKRAISFTPFIIYAFLDIFMVFFYTDVMVVNVNGFLDYAKFGLQQFTQYAYLLISFLIYKMVYVLLQKGILTNEKLFKVLENAYIAVLVLCLFQWLLPPDIVQLTFRNSVHSLFNLYHDRISSTFAEPSFLSYYLTPLFAMQVYFFIKRPNMKYLWLILAGCAVFVQNKSSSFFLGTIFLFVLIVTIKAYDLPLRNKPKFKKSQPLFIFVVLLLVTIIGIIYYNSVKEGFDILISKLNQDMWSGKSRLSHFDIGMEIVKSSPFFGIGFGSLRLTNGLMSWFAQLGIVGFSLYLFPVGKLLLLLLKRRTVESRALFLALSVSHIIFFVSVPEFMIYLSWILFAMAQHQVEIKKEKVLQFA